MKKQLMIISTALMMGSGCTSDSDTEELPASDATIADSCHSRFSEPLEAWESAGFSGAVALSGNDVDCFMGLGLANDSVLENTAGTQFSIGSVSKTLTAVAALSLVEEGLLTLDGPIGTWVDELTGDTATVTTAQLMTHTSGLPQSHASDYVPVSQAEALSAINGLDVLFPPGTDYAYSNAGFTLLAIVVERASGVDFRDYLTTNVLTLADGRQVGAFWDGEPILEAPRAIGFFEDGSTGEAGDFPGPFWAMEGSGGLAFTTRGLHDWLRALTDGELLSTESLELMTVPRVPFDDGVSEAYGWLVIDDISEGARAIGISGGGGSVGHETLMVWLPDSDQIMVIASHRPRITATTLSEPVLEAMVSGDELAEPVEGVELDAEALLAFTGQYVFEDQSTIDVDVDDAKLELSAIGNTAIRAVFPISDRLDDSAVASHEQFALDYLSGSTPEAMTDLESLREEFGEVTSSDLAGTGFIGGELRTYFAVVAGGEELLGWIAFDGFGGVSALDFDIEPPIRSVVSVSETEFVSDGLSDSEDISVGFDAAIGELRIGIEPDVDVAQRN